MRVEWVGLKPKETPRGWSMDIFWSSKLLNYFCCSLTGILNVYLLCFCSLAKQNWWGRFTRLTQRQSQHHKTKRVCFIKLLLETNRKIVKNTVKGSTAQRIRLYKDTKTLWLVFLYLNSSLPFKITEAKDLSKTVVILYSKSFLLLCCNKKNWMFVNLSWTGIDRNSQAWIKRECYDPELWFCLTWNVTGHKLRRSN